MASAGWQCSAWQRRHAAPRLRAPGCTAWGRLDSAGGCAAPHRRAGPDAPRRPHFSLFVLSGGRCGSGRPRHPPGWKKTRGPLVHGWDGGPLQQAILRAACGGSSPGEAAPTAAAELAAIRAPHTRPSPLDGAELERAAAAAAPQPARPRPPPALSPLARTRLFFGGSNEGRLGATPPMVEQAELRFVAWWERRGI